MTDTLENTRIGIGLFCGFSGAKIVLLNVNVNAGQNKFEIDILKNVAKKAKIPLLSLNINWHNSVIFYPILTLFFFELLVFSRKISLFGLDFGVRPHFCSEASSG